MDKEKLEPKSADQQKISRDDEQNPPENTIKEDQSKRSHFVADHDYMQQTDVISKQKKTRKLKLKTITAIFNCSLCGYRTLKKEFLRIHRCYNLKRPTGNVKHATKYINRPINNNHAIHNINKTTSNIEQSASDISSHVTIDIKPTDDNINHAASHIKHATSTKMKPLASPLKCSQCPFNGKNEDDLKRHYEEAENGRCHCGFDVHKEHQLVSHKRIHSVTMIVLPDLIL